MELLATIEIPKYIRTVKLVDARRATYYEEGETIPKKYQTEEYKFIFFAKKKKKFLVDSDGELVVKNPNVAGTSKYKIIKGQDVYNLTIKDYEKGKIVMAIKGQMIPEVEKLEPILKYPIRILCELHDTYFDHVHIKKNGEVNKGIDWDIDNRGLLYCKTFPDVLSGCPYVQEKGKEKLFKSKRIIPDDHRKFITQPPVPLFFPIKNAEDRKLVFKIYHDDRDIIKNSEHYG